MDKKTKSYITLALIALIYVFVAMFVTMIEFFIEDKAQGSELTIGGALMLIFSWIPGVSSVPRTGAGWLLSFLILMVSLGALFGIFAQIMIIIVNSKLSVLKLWQKKTDSQTLELQTEVAQIKETETKIVEQQQEIIEYEENIIEKLDKLRSQKKV